MSRGRGGRRDTAPLVPPSLNNVVATPVASAHNQHPALSGSFDAAAAPRVTRSVATTVALAKTSAWLPRSPDVLY